MNIDKEHIKELVNWIDLTINFETAALSRTFTKDYQAVSKGDSLGDTNAYRRVMRVVEASSPASKLKGVYINNIKSLKNTTIDFSNLNLIAGVNSIGKSTLLEAIAILPRFFDSDMNIIPLGDDKFGIKNFNNFLSFDANPNEYAEISLNYENVFQETVIGEVNIKLIFNDDNYYKFPGVDKNSRSIAIKKLNNLPIKKIELSITQDPEKITDEMSIIPISSVISIEREDVDFDKKPIVLGRYLQTQAGWRIDGYDMDPPDFEDNLYKLNTKNTETYKFSASVTTAKEKLKNFDNTVVMHNVNWDKLNLSLQDHVLEVTSTNTEDPDTKTKGKIFFEGNMSIDISKYLRIILLDLLHKNIHERVSKKKKPKGYEKFTQDLQEKIFYDLLSKSKEYKDISWEEIKSNYIDAFPDGPKILFSSTEKKQKEFMQYLIETFLTAKALTSRIPNAIGDFSSVNLPTKEYDLGLFDCVEINSLKTAETTYTNTKEDWIEIWFDDNFDSKRITDHLKMIFENRRKQYASNKVFDEKLVDIQEELLGDYHSFFEEVEDLINDTVTKLNVSELNESHAVLKNYVDKLNYLIVSKKIDYPLISKWHSSISQSTQIYTLRDLLLMKISNQEHSKNDLMIPIWRKENPRAAEFLTFYNRRFSNVEENVFNKKLFNTLENTKNIQFLGPLRDRGDSAKLFYTNDKPFTLGIYGEYSKIFLSDNATNRAEFVSPKLFDKKIINKLLAIKNLDEFQNKEKIDLLKEHGVIEEMEYIDYLSLWANYIGIAEKLSISGESGIPTIYVSDKENNKIEIVNVGIGVSQVLPVIMICSIPQLNRLEFKPNSNIFTTLLEQPELHLHPKAQARLSDFILSTSIFDSIILETHSEYTLHRLRYRLAELNSFYKNTINLNFAKKDKKDQVLFEKIPVNDQGGLESYPKDFFDQSQLQAQEFIELKINKTDKK